MAVWATLRTRSWTSSGLSRWLAWLTLAATLLAVMLIVDSVDREALRLAFTNLLGNPGTTLAALIAFAFAFLLRALAWTRVLPLLSLTHSWAAIHVALAGNHVLPLRLGEPLRVMSAVRRTPISPAEATASTLALRSADVVAVVGLGLLLGAGIFSRSGNLGSGLLLGAVVGVGIAGLIWLHHLRKGPVELRLPGLVALGLTVAAWFAESILVWVVAMATGIEITLLQAVFVTTVSVAAQVFALAPGGLGTYEAGAVAAYVFLGFDPGTALAAALASHALKTAYSLVAGGVALMTPAPSLLGQMRLPRPPPGRPEPFPILPHQPVVMFLPAHNESESVGDVVRRIPYRAHGQPVVGMVIDDGSDDGTADEAIRAGAEVVSWKPNRGLGAAVRAGLAAALDLDPAAVVFCDADGEYAPEELERMVAPILVGKADYVVGSRFGGEIERMLLHRRLGNRVLTLALSWAARQRIGDGQSGYRALSRRAATAAEIVHDYNYAQVLTLDLLGKGFEYTEMPISYRFRTTGRSFIRLHRYLRNVLPAVYRELNHTSESRPESAPSSGSDRLQSSTTCSPNDAT